MNIERQAVMTCVYAPDARMEAVALRCLRSILSEFPNDQRIVAIDQAPPSIAAYAGKMGWTVIEPTGGQPPRLGSLMKACLARVKTDVVWTIEHDAQVLRGTRNPVSRLLDKFPRVAGLECLSTNRDGKIVAPCSVKQMYAYPGTERIYHQIPWSSLNCVAWRTEALRSIDWSLMPEWPACDKVISWLLVKGGWDLCVAPDYPCLHHDAKARRELPGQRARPVALPCLNIVDVGKLERSPEPDEGGVMSEPMVDVLIATIGRASLQQAMIAAFRQTYPNVRCVVVSDGPNPGARSLFERVGGNRKDAIYREAPGPNGRGDPVKEWWFHQEEAAPFVKILDDDDWMSPITVDEMMKPILAGENVVLSLCLMLVLKTRGEMGPAARWRIVEANLKPNQVGSGCVLVRTEAARKAAFEKRPFSDFHWIKQVARHGAVAHVPYPLYIYHGYRGNHERGYAPPPQTQLEEYQNKERKLMSEIGKIAQELERETSEPVVRGLAERRRRVEDSLDRLHGMMENVTDAYPELAAV